MGEEEHAKNNLPDALSRWARRDADEIERPRTSQSFCVPREEIAATGAWDLSLNRYKEVERAAADHAPPAEIIRELREIKAEIAEGLDRLEEMLA